MKIKLSMFSGILNLIISCIPLLLIVAIIVILVFCFKAKVRIKFHTFVGKSFRAKRGDFGTFAYVGKQGSG